MNEFLKNLLKWILFATPLVLLVVPDSMYFPFISGKNFLFRFLIEIALGLYIFLAFKLPELRPRKSPVLIAVVTFTFIAFAADLLSPNFAKAFWSNFERMDGFITIMHLCVYVVVLGSVFKRYADWSTFFFSSIAVSVAMNLYGWLQFIGGAAINQGATRIDAVMGNSAYMAGFLLFQAFIILFLLKREGNDPRKIALSLLAGSLLFGLVRWSDEIPSKQGKIMVATSIIASLILVWLSRIWKDKKAIILSYSVYGIIFISHVVLLYYTQTRGAVLGFIGAVFVMALIVAIKEKNKALQRTALVFVCLVLVLVSGFFMARKTKFVTENPILSRFAQISWSGAQGQARQIIWPMALEGVKEKPLLGWGQEGFNYVFAKYYNPELWRQEPWFDRTHNVFLDWLVAAGILGFLAYLSLYVLPIVGLIRGPEFKDRVTEAAILAGLICAYAFQNLFIFDNLGSYLLFFSFLGFAHYYFLDSKKEDAKRAQAHHTKSKNVEEVNPMLIAAISVGLALSAAYFLTYVPYNQNKTLIKAMQPQQTGPMTNLDYFGKVFSGPFIGHEEAREQLASIVSQIVVAQGLDPKIKQAFYDEFIKQAKQQIVEAPLGLKPIVSMGTYMNQIGVADEALTYLEVARKASPKKQLVLLQIGVSYLIRNDMANAKLVFKEAHDLAPDYRGAAMFYALTLLNSNEDEAALVILRQFADIGFMPEPYVFEALAKKQNLKQQTLIIFETAYKHDPTDYAKSNLQAVYQQLGEPNHPLPDAKSL